MATLCRTKFAVVISQLLRRREVVATITRVQGTQVLPATRIQEHLTLVHPISSIPHRDKVADGEGARIVGSDSDIYPYEDFPLLDSKEQGIGSGDCESEDKNDSKDGNWRDQLSWLSNIVDSPLNKYPRTPQPEELAEKYEESASARSLLDIGASLIKSTAGMQQWGLADITFGLYLLSLRHSSEAAVDTIIGEQITSDYQIQKWIYYLELAWGAYMKNANALSRVSMLKEENVIKFVCKASVMRPAYYIGVDTRHKMVIMCIRGTQTVHDLITDIATYSEHAAVFDGEAVHYGSFEAAQWLLRNETITLKQCLQENEGFRLLVVGHSLGGATAALLGMLLRQNSEQTLGLSPENIKVIGIGTPPCLSKHLASKSRAFTSTLVLQDDVIPRMSTTALIQLRNEILLLDWTDVLKEGIERKGLVDLVASTLQALTTVQDAARKYGALARRTINLNGSVDIMKKEAGDISNDDLERQKRELMQTVKPLNDHPELHAPGILYHVRRHFSKPSHKTGTTIEQRICSLWRGGADTRVGRIIISSTMLSDHRCESYYYALRDVLKDILYSHNQ